MKYIRSDFVLSYWIFVWSILYLLGIVKTAPMLLIYMGLFGNLVELIYLFYSNATKYNLIKFIIINTFLKIIPLYLIGIKAITYFEVKLTILFLLQYVLWLYINKVEIYNVYSGFLKTYETGTGPKTFLSEYYDKIYKLLKAN